MNYIKGSLALVHNGNIMNADEIKKAQMFRGQAHYTTSDSEVLVYEIISERIHSKSIEDAVLPVAGNIKGGFACIIMSPRKLVGFRDPYGIKPLLLGKRTMHTFWPRKTLPFLPAGILSEETAYQDKPIIRRICYETYRKRHAAMGR